MTNTAIAIRHSLAALGGLIALLGGTGCYTYTGDLLAPIEPPPSPPAIEVEHSVGEFFLVWGEGEPSRSPLAGKLLANETMEAWEKRGYVREARFVSESAFSETARYRLTLTGRQRNEAGFFRQVFSGLTLLLIPYTVTQNYQLHFVLDDVDTGARYTAEIEAEDETTIELLFLPAFPFAQRGHRETMQRVGDHVYDQLRRQGAFKDGP